MVKDIADGCSKTREGVVVETFVYIQLLNRLKKKVRYNGNRLRPLFNTPFISTTIFTLIPMTIKLFDSMIHNNVVTLITKS